MWRLLSEGEKMMWKDTGGREGCFCTDFISKRLGRERGGEIRVVLWDHAVVEVTSAPGEYSRGNNWSVVVRVPGLGMGPNFTAR